MILNVWIKSDGLVEINRITSTILTLMGKFPGHELDQFMENSSKIEHLVEKWYLKNSGAWHRPISGKLIQIWTGYQEIGPAHALEIEISKNSGYVFQKSVRVTPRKDFYR